MLKKSILAVALTLTLATSTNALAAVKYQPVQDDNQALGAIPPDQRWLDRAKGSID